MSFIFKYSKDTAWRERVVKNLVGDVIIHDKIETSLPLAKSLVKVMSRLITWAKQDTLHSRRLALRYLINKKHLGVLDKLFSDLKVKYQTRESGYVSIKRLFYRRGDNSLRVQVSLV